MGAVCEQKLPLVSGDGLREYPHEYALGYLLFLFTGSCGRTWKVAGGDSINTHGANGTGSVQN